MRLRVKRIPHGRWRVTLLDRQVSADVRAKSRRHAVRVAFAAPRLEVLN